MSPSGLEVATPGLVITKTRLEEQALEEYPLCIGWLVTNTKFLVKRTETRLDQIQGPQTVGGESNTGTVAQELVLFMKGWSPWNR